MEKKLYCVRVVMYVMAENASGACVAATKAPFDIFECRARKADRIDDDWQDAIPYNADDERNCAEVLAAEKRERPAPLVIQPPVHYQSASMRMTIKSAPSPISPH